MTVTLYLLDRDPDGFVAKCDEFPGWSYTSRQSWMDLTAVLEAERALREYAAAHLTINRTLTKVPA